MLNSNLSNIIDYLENNTKDYILIEKIIKNEIDYIIFSNQENFKKKNSTIKFNKKNNLLIK